MTFSETWLEKYLPEKGRTFIDVGANVGEYTLKLAPRFDRVIAFEPNSQAHDVLKEEIEKNHIGNVVLYRLALSKRGGFQAFNIFENSVHTSRVMDSETNINAGQTIARVAFPTAKLDSFSYRSVDFIKIDVEGMEDEVVKGGLLTICQHRPIMLIEIHAPLNEDKIRRMLRGFRFEVIRHPHYKPTDRYYTWHYWLYFNPNEAKENR